MKFTPEEIQKIIDANQKVRVNLNLRTPMFGKFVICKDHNEMISKGLVRFVIDSRIELFEGNSLEDTQQIYKGKETIAKLISIKEITYIKQF